MSDQETQSTERINELVRENHDLRAQIADVTRERDEARSERDMAIRAKVYGAYAKMWAGTCDALEERLAIAVEALEWYSNENTVADTGQVAIHALAKIRGEKP